MKDLFMDMQAKIGCPYLSDLPYYKRAVWFEMKRLCLSDYPKKQLEDFSRYVFSVPYTVIQEALQRKDVMKHGNMTGRGYYMIGLKKRDMKKILKAGAKVLSGKLNDALSGRLIYADFGFPQG